ncbi:MAG: glycosyltransferase [Pseudomonadota bacterium]
MKLSVSLVTYQHIQTAEEAINSVLDQQTVFPFEIIVGDDASTDGTRDLLEFHRARHPVRIRLLLHDTNAGDYGLTNVMSTMDAASGEYVAFLDGDDFWTSPDKLQKQVDFLDAHPDCAICAHRVEHLHDDGVRILSAGAPQGTGTYPVGALIARNFAPKISTVVRKSALADLPEWYRRTTVASADWVLNVLASRKARVGFIDEVLAVHRVHSASVSAGYGAEKMFADKLKILPVLQELVPEASDELNRLRRQLRMKKFVAGCSPRVFSVLRRIGGLTRTQPEDQGIRG